MHQDLHRMPLQLPGAGDLMTLVGLGSLNKKLKLTKAGVGLGMWSDKNKNRWIEVPNDKPKSPKVSQHNHHYDRKSYHTTCPDCIIQRTGMTMTGALEMARDYHSRLKNLEKQNAKLKRYIKRRENSEHSLRKLLQDHEGRLEDLLESSCHQQDQWGRSYSRPRPLSPPLTLDYDPYYWHSGPYHQYSHDQPPSHYVGFSHYDPLDHYQPYSQSDFPSHSHFSSRGSSRGYSLAGGFN